VNYRESRRSPFLAGIDDLSRERSHSEHTSREIDEEISRIFNESLEKVRNILQMRRKTLVALAERLIEKEVIDNEELRQIIEANSPNVSIVPGTADASRRPAEPPKEQAVEAKIVENG